MTGPQSKAADRIQQRLALAGRCHGAAPDCYRAQAQWWRIAALDSANPADDLFYADSLDRLAADMEASPDYYARKPDGVTDWEWRCQR